MYKKIISILFIILLVACTKEKIYLDDEYYNNGEYIEVDSNYFNDNSHKNYIIYVSNTFCMFSVPCADIFEEYMKKYNISFLSIKIDEYKKTKFYEKVKYVPTVIIVRDGKILSYLNAESDDDINKYQDISEFESWVNKYIYYEK